MLAELRLIKHAVRRGQQDRYVLREMYKRLIRGARHSVLGNDVNQERLFFTLVRECLEKGVFDIELVRREMAANHVRHDALDLCQRLAA